jgi:glycosyltransferase involved in cell wall biosynthesis
MLPAATMRILIFHGYLLRGTGSNVYNAELARALVAAGHDVELVCQEKRAEELEWVDALGTWDNAGELSVRDFGRAGEREAGRGRCTVYLPPIADQLPVYVQDNYQDFVARTFDQFDDEELAFYISRNVMAVKAVAALTSPDVALANHMVMGPFILSQSLDESVPYVAKIHGSAMEYTVRPHPRFLPYARNGVDGARAILVGSHHIAGRVWDTLRIPGIEERIFLGPPGVDVAAFRPLDRAKARAGLADVGEKILGLPRLGYGPAQHTATDGLYDRVRTAARMGGMMPYEDISADVAELQRSYENSGIDASAGDDLRALAAIGDAPLALYVGKLIVSKGVDLLAVAWPLVRAKHPDARLLITGFGAYREGFELLISALSDGDLVTARWIASGGRALEGGEAAPLKLVLEFFDSLDDDAREAYLEAAKGMRESIVRVGRLEHDLLVDITPAADCQIVPSTFPEAFGMVAAEAAACGVPPISADHSGLAEVTKQLQDNLSGASASLLSFRLTSSAVEQLASRIHAALALSGDQRAELSARLVQTAEERFSWGRVASELLDAARGRSESLRRP